MVIKRNKVKKTLAIVATSSDTIILEISLKGVKEMNNLVAIHKLSAQLGLTSRTLRHWESEELFCSIRDNDSGWRFYDENAVLCIRIISLLRKFDVPIIEIKTVMDNKTFDKLQEVIINRLSALRAQRIEISNKEKQLIQFLSFLQEQNDQLITDANLSKLQENIKLTTEFQYEMEELMMLNQQENSINLRFITLPPMRVAYNVAVSVSPEDEAMVPVIEWLKSANLTGTARLFGGNMNPMPSGEGKPYGYGMCASIPEKKVVPDNLKEMKLPGGLYAMLESSDDIGGSWNTLMRVLSINDKYEPDHSRLCFEEHIRNDSPDGSKQEYFLNLLEPVKIKK
jgi:DNA-binding transcriptional MerR regulator/DNA gyrase inhibitor GyrI